MADHLSKSEKRRHLMALWRKKPELSEAEKPIKAAEREDVVNKLAAQHKNQTPILAP